MLGFVETLRLTDADASLVGKCLRAAVDGPFFPDWEFQTLIGVSREEVRNLVDAWPGIEASRDNLAIVSNSLNNLSGYPHGEDTALLQNAGAGRADISNCLERLRRHAISVDLL